VYKWILPSISEILAATEPNITSCTSENSEETVLKQNCGGDVTSSVRCMDQKLKACQSGMGVVCSDLRSRTDAAERINSDMPSPVDGCLRPTQGLVFAGPVPILSHMALLSSLQTWALQPRRCSQSGDTISVAPCSSNQDTNFIPY